VDRVRPVAALAELLEDEADRPGDDPPVRVPGGPPGDCKGFSGPGLAVREDGAVDAVQRADHHFVRGALEDDVLWKGRGERGAWEEACSTSRGDGSKKAWAGKQIHMWNLLSLWKGNDPFLVERHSASVRPGRESASVRSCARELFKQWLSLLRG
jgi:hypothetical protein